MFYIAIPSLLFGLFMAWMAWGDRKYEPDPLKLGAWGHYTLTVGLLAGSSATTATAIYVMFFL
jgi:hypothetical protein